MIVCACVCSCDYVFVRVRIPSAPSKLGGSEITTPPSYVSMSQSAAVEEAGGCVLLRGGGGGRKGHDLILDNISVTVCTRYVEGVLWIFFKLFVCSC